jgi:hypothetical protein
VEDNIKVNFIKFSLKLGFLGGSCSIVDFCISGDGPYDNAVLLLYS